MSSKEPCAAGDVVTTDASYEQTSWHDNFIDAVRFDAHEFESNLCFDIDHILKWVRADETRYQFWIAPASLIFHDVTDLSMRVDFGASGFQQMVHQLSIGSISRTLVTNQKICLDRPYYSWLIQTNWPDGEFTFGASGYTQALLSEPVLCDDQQIESAVRGPAASRLARLTVSGPDISRSMFLRTTGTFAA